MIVLLLLNAVVAAAGIALALVAALRPSALLHGAHGGVGERFYARMYAAKAVPLGLLAAIAPFAAPGVAAGLCLIAAALSQAADAVIGLARGDWRQAGGSLVAVVVHVVVAVAIW